MDIIRTIFRLDKTNCLVPIDSVYGNGLLNRSPSYFLLAEHTEQPGTYMWRRIYYKPVHSLPLVLKKHPHSHIIQFKEWHLKAEIVRIFVNNTYMGAAYLDHDLWRYLPGSKKSKLACIKEARIVRLTHYNKQPLPHIY